MKITNNEIRVQLMNGIGRLEDERNSQRAQIGYNIAIADIEMMNPPCVVDVEALAGTIRKYCCQAYTFDSLAQHLAANLDKWLIEKKEDKCDLK